MFDRRSQFSKVRTLTLMLDLFGQSVQFYKIYLQKCHEIYKMVRKLNVDSVVTCLRPRFYYPLDVEIEIRSERLHKISCSHTAADLPVCWSE